MFGDCFNADCNACWILCFPLPVGVLSKKCVQGVGGVLFGGDMIEWAHDKNKARI